MNGPDYYAHPIFLLYWIVLKSHYSSLEKWKDEMIKHREINNKFGICDLNSDPITFMTEFIEKYVHKV